MLVTNLTVVQEDKWYVSQVAHTSRVTSNLSPLLAHPNRFIFLPQDSEHITPLHKTFYLSPLPTEKKKK